MRAPAESTSHTIGTPVRYAVLDDPDDLLDRPRAPRARLHRRVVGHQAHRAAVDGRGTGDDAVGRQVAGESVGVEAVLDEGPLVDEQPDPLAGEQLALRRRWPRGTSALRRPSTRSRRSARCGCPGASLGSRSVTTRQGSDRARTSRVRPPVAVSLRWNQEGDPHAGHVVRCRPVPAHHRGRSSRSRWPASCTPAINVVPRGRRCRSSPVGCASCTGSSRCSPSMALLLLGLGILARAPRRAHRRRLLLLGRLGHHGDRHARRRRGTPAASSSRRTARSWPVIGGDTRPTGAGAEEIVVTATRPLFWDIDPHHDVRFPRRRVPDGGEADRRMGLRCSRSSARSSVIVLSRRAAVRDREGPRGRPGPSQRERSAATAGSQRLAVQPAGTVRVRGPARSTCDGSVRPTMRSAVAAASINASRSMPVVDAHVLDHVHELFGRDVAGGARRIRTAAEAADARVEVATRRARARRARWPARCRACCGSAG